MIEKKTIEVNKYPFFLWLNYKTNVDINQDESYVIGNKKSYYAKVDTKEIFLIKYLFLFVLFFAIRLPSSIQDLFAILIALFVLAGFLLVWKKKKEYFNIYGVFIFIAIIVFFLAGLVNARVLNSTMQYFMLFYLAGYIYYDYKKKNIGKYYKLIDIKNKGKVDVSKKANKKALRIPFTQKHLLNRNMGFNISFNYNIGGHYFYILPNYIEELNDENNQ
ncbi:MAG: hypothetical protein M0R46_09970 [Candidatus Muirbacterium halophilum]|nr:hypothetical protein [Candidatus Muirbacterium halophilum]